MHKVSSCKPCGLGAVHKTELMPQYCYATHSLSNLYGVVTIAHCTCSYWVQLLFLYHPSLVSIKANDAHVFPNDFS
jgi:hypothetical protein